MRDESGPGGPLSCLRSSFVCCLGGLRATYVAACKCRSAAEEDECESETRADSSVLPVKAGRDDLRLADRPRLRADELDLVARAAARECPDDLDLIAPVNRVVHGHRARHAVCSGDDVVARRAALRADELDRITPKDRAGRHCLRGHVDPGRGGEVRRESLIAVRLDGRALVDPRLRDRGCDRCDGEPEGEPLDEPIPSPIAAHLPAPFLLTSTADAHKTGETPLSFHQQAAPLVGVHVPSASGEKGSGMCPLPRTFCLTRKAREAGGLILRTALVLMSPARGIAHPSWTASGRIGLQISGVRGRHLAARKIGLPGWT